MEAEYEHARWITWDITEDANVFRCKRCGAFASVEHLPDTDPTLARVMDYFVGTHSKCTQE